MSRYSKKIEPSISVAWGFDYFFGFFFDVFNETTEEEIVASKSSLNGNSNGEIVEMMIDYDIPEEHINQVLLDLPF
jgi:hypothetical protein